MDTLITDLRLTTGSDSERRDGLLGYISFVYCHALRFDGITLRRTTSGRLGLSFPKRQNAAGHVFHFIEPVTLKAREAIELAVLGQLAIDRGPSE